MDDNKRCIKVLENGKQCNAWVRKGKSYCFSHDPESHDAKLLATKKGGLAQAVVIKTPLEPVVINTPKDVVVLLTMTVNELREGRMDYRVANTISYLSNALLKAFEISELHIKIEQVKSVIVERTSEKSEDNLRKA
jgi:hypothetical protein